ncbi:MAG: nucleotide exchange factor GrpE [Candidatus Omnitrophica bacterium]|nr:nucleotide exchange factor GrpE [Candidatus Omnitrophota bacterium]MBU1047130.1 nucleotide exchange factor GrpE [Candidatus Omnitrophota bacterium]MBU1631565.1 nucleotide exchange factor GrpE [Candidatus Omnitrophota bacterium]MBU1766559.1 nucleotide exchange factor GrpE [Candidatus Omnitrophota bacterium]MBU1889592.1 nucleotide exchange factor GrpE [Candidatus Omnitrophota bacterium]
MNKTRHESKTRKELINLERKKDEQISALMKEKEEYIDKWKRVLAELENYRKRNEKQRDEIKKFALENVLYQLLSVKDNFDRALAHISTSDSDNAVRQGVEMIYKEFKNLLTQQGVKSIKALGKEYDPKLHEALEMIHEEKKGNWNKYIVVEEVLPGYTLHDRLLRPAKVKVAEKKEEPKTIKGEENEK